MAQKLLESLYPLKIVRVTTLMWPFSQAQIQDRFRRNMLFLQENMPDLFKKLKEVRFQRLTLSVDETKQRWDIFDGQRSLYLGDGEGYADQEVATFHGYFAQGAAIKSIAPIQKENYGAPRFFHTHLRQTMHLMDYKAMSQHYHLLTDTMPMVVFTGIGGGVHIQRFLAKKDCRIVLIYETDPEALLMSLYLTDWYEIIPKYISKEGRFFNFILVDSKNERAQFVGFWNELIRYVPLFPALNVFYNHLKNAQNDRIIQRIQTEFKVFLTAWGYYDDEANQFNNALHNLRNLIPTLPQKLEPNLTQWAKENPVVIVGAGPSLNKRIDWIKANRQRFFLISAGTSLSILKHHQVIPDLHVEIESDYATHSHLSHTLDENYKIPALAGAIQLNSKVFNLVSKAFLYYKDSTALHAMFGDKTSAKLIGMTPTCTNAATGLALQLGFTKLFLFGMDFGYKDKTKTHATGSVYFNDSAPAILRESIAMRQSEMHIESIDDEVLLTEPIYNSARDRLEKVLYAYNKLSTAYNCSTGAKIESTQVLRTQDDFEALLGDKEDAQAELYRETLLSQTVLLAPSEIEKGVTKALDFMQSACDYVTQEIERMDLDRNGLTITLLKMARRFEDHYRQTKSPLYFLVRGTIWHYFNAGITVAYATHDNAIANQHLKLWQTRFLDFLNKWPQHFDWIAQRNLNPEDDLWLVRHITEPVDDDPFYAQLMADQNPSLEVPS